MLLVLFRTGKRDELPNPSSDVNRGMYDGFSETQTESQVYALTHWQFVGWLFHEDINLLIAWL